MDEEKQVIKVRKLSAEEILSSFYNIHLKEVMSAFINIDIYERKNPNDVVGERAGPPLREGQMGLKIQVKAKEALDMEKKRFENQSEVLISIERRLEQLKKIKQDNQIWQKK